MTLKETSVSVSSFVEKFSRLEVTKKRIEEKIAIKKKQNIQKNDGKNVLRTESGIQNENNICFLRERAMGTTM
jgi:hypothetical protein